MIECIKAVVVQATTTAFLFMTLLQKGLITTEAQSTRRKSVTIQPCHCERAFSETLKVSETFRVWREISNRPARLSARPAMKIELPTSKRCFFILP